MLISAIALFMTMMVSAQVTADVTLRLESESGSVCDLYLFAGPDLGVNPERGSFFANASNPEDVNIYAVDPTTGNKYSSFGNEVLTNIPIGVITSKEAEAKQNYTIRFTVDANTETLKLTDLVTGTVTEITNGGHYDFSVTSANAPSYEEGSYSTIAKRFIINHDPSSLEFKVCHIGDEVTIENNPYEGKIVITDVDKVAHEYDPAPSIDVSTLPEGRATLKIGNHTYVIIIKH